jgi:hypothetical protein
VRGYFTATIVDVIRARDSIIKRRDNGRAIVSPARITLSLPWLAQERQNPPREVLGNYRRQSQQSRLELGLRLSDCRKHLTCALMIDISFTPFPFLTTENYALRNLKPEDEQEIFALRSSDEINKYLDRPKANTLDDAQSFITKIINGIAENEAIFCRPCYHKPENSR